MTRNSASEIGNMSSCSMSPQQEPLEPDSLVLSEEIANLAAVPQGALGPPKTMRTIFFRAGSIDPPRAAFMKKKRGESCLTGTRKRSKKPALVPLPAKWVDRLGPWTASTFYCELDSLKATLERDGVAVIKGVLDASECEKVFDLWWEWLQHLVIRDKKGAKQILRDDPSTWNLLQPYVSIKGHVGKRGVGQNAASWFVRSRPRVIAAFKEIWGTDDLLVEYFLNKGCKWHNALVPAGDLVLWDSRTVHMGIQPRVPRDVPRTRFVVYVCMTPRERASDDDIKRRVEVYNKCLTTSHQPDKFRLAGGDDHVKPRGNRAVLNERQKKLLGADPDRRS